MQDKLNRGFYLRNTVQVARELIGKELIYRSKRGLTSGIIVETEAYSGIDDPACHSYRGRRTDRTSVMFEEGGRAYVYMIYGMHYCFNVVTREKGVPEAVLIRALKPEKGISLMRKRRNIKSDKIEELTSGPGKLTQAMGIDDNCYGLDLCGEKLFIKKGNEIIKDENIVAAERINIDYAGKAKDYPWRFYLRRSPFVSVKIGV